MGDEISPYDWLPAGWKVEARVRRNGKRDKCYTDPLSEHKFYSKLEVLRYLESVRNKCGDSTRESSKNLSATKVVIKEAVAEGLPAGWIKEIRVTKKGNKIRRDPYYIDPATGHLFRSMKEVFRYLDTGNKPIRAPKPKEPVLIESPAKTGKERSANKAQKLDTENPNHKAAEEAPATDHVNQSKIDNLEQRENKEKSSESRSPVVEDLRGKLQPGEGVEGHGTECKNKKKLSKKRGPELPRRSSKRLAGIAIELPLELKMSNRVHQAAATHAGEGEAKCADNFQDSKNSKMHVKDLRTENHADDKQEDLGVSSLGDAGFQEEHTKQGVVKCKGDKQQETPVDSSLKDLWKDPCIEFAIKTLTGVIPIVEVLEHKVAKDAVFSVGLPGAVPENKDSPLGNIWADPCIEFAVKTLTGDVPIGNNRGIQNVFQRPHYSTNFGEEKGLLLPNIWSNERSPAGVSFTHSDKNKKTVHKQL